MQESSHNGFRERERERERERGWSYFMCLVCPNLQGDLLASARVPSHVGREILRDSEREKDFSDRAGVGGEIQPFRTSETVSF